MFHQKRQGIYNKEEQRSARGPLTPAEFLNKFNLLKDRWLKWSEIKGDSEPTRLISSIFTQRGNPTNIALVANNVEYFKNNEDKYAENDLKNILQLACLCGSRAIGEFVMNKLKVDFEDKNYNFMLNYVAASTNDSWALELAKDIKHAQKNLKIMPEDIYFFCDNESLRTKIKQIFEGDEFASKRTLTNKK